MVKAPCKGCDNREIACHSKCEKFVDYRQKVAEERKKIQAERDKFSEFPMEIKKKLDKRAKQKLTR